MELFLFHYYSRQIHLIVNYNTQQTVFFCDASVLLDMLFPKQHNLPPIGGKTPQWGEPYRLATSSCK